MLSLIEQSPARYSVRDLCERFQVEIATIQRDLSSLRGMGFLIHSANNCLKLFKPLTKENYEKLLSVYLPLSAEALGFPKNIPLSIKRLKEKSLTTFVSLVNAIEWRQEIEIRYLRVYDGKTVMRRLQPYQLFPTTRDWRLIGKSDGIYKQFIVDNITQIKVTSTVFKRDANFDLQKLFQYSFDLFKTDQPVTVELHFSKNAATAIENRVWSETQIIETQKNRDILLRMQIGDLDEIIGWVMSWGNGVRVVQPVELRNRIRKLAANILKEYRKATTQ
jgi:predicted DNA-binding transcriptional regulator YafY